MTEGSDDEQAMSPITVRAMARALACAGELDQAATWRSRATEAGAAIADDEDRDIFTGDLADGPWFGLAADQELPTE